MGEITGAENVDQHQAAAAADVAVTGEPGKVETDVKGVFADGEKQGAPVFNVSHGEFYSNMTHGRKRLRLKNGTAGSSYMQQTKYNRPFWMSYKDPSNGEVWTRKVK
jgi:hypothetical protein